jgi:hypothetical protein
MSVLVAVIHFRVGFSCFHPALQNLSLQIGELVDLKKKKEH